MTTRRDVLRRAGSAALAALPLSHLITHAADARRKPNVILFLADDLGYAETGCYGQQRIRTPRIDRLAREGVRFTQCYSGSPVCAPSRCVLLTGLHTGHAFIRDNREITPEGQLPLPSGTRTLPLILREAGYAMGLVGKWGLGFPGSSGDPLNQGFDHFFGYNCQRHAHNHYPAYLWRNNRRIELDGNADPAHGTQYAPDLMEREALDFIGTHRDRPFFLFYATTIPHLALQAPEEDVRAYAEFTDDPPYDGSKGYRACPRPRATYAAMVSHFDRSVGRIMDAVHRHGLDRDTIVIFASDNGSTFDIGGYDPAFFNGTGTFRGAKGSVFEGGVRVPLIVRWPDHIAPGSTSGHVCAFQDLLPTICDLTDTRLTAPAVTDGLSVAPTLLGRPGQKIHDHLYFEFPDYGGQQMVRMGDWSGVRQNLGKDPDAPLQLYDLRTDIGQQRDVAQGNPGVVRRMLEVMRTARVPSPEFPFPALDR